MNTKYFILRLKEAPEDGNMIGVFRFWCYVESFDAVRNINALQITVTERIKEIFAIPPKDIVVHYPEVFKSTPKEMYFEADGQEYTITMEQTYLLN